MTNCENAKLVVHPANMTIARVPTAPQAEANVKSHSPGLIHAAMAV
jgi:hypothetical protein